MTIDREQKQRQLRSLVKASGELELSLASVDIPRPADHEVCVRVEAAPINPSDLILLFAAADLGTAKASGTADSPVITAQIPERVRKSMALRVDKSMPTGIEGAGVVIEAGASPAAQALLGKTVAAFGGATYAQYTCIAAEQCLVLPEGATAIECASSFVNPLTALGFVETMRREGHTALVHTAAASSLGQMLLRLCLEEGISLVNIVRKEEQEKLLRDLGATHVLNMTSPTFLSDLTEALAATGATLAFDAIGGGKLAGQIVSCMEVALNRTAKSYNRYGSTKHKQVYIYGALDMAPTELVRSVGFAWGVGGWLLGPFLQKSGPEVVKKLQERVAKGLRTTFATHYAKQLSLVELLTVDAVAALGKPTTGQKVLVLPNK